MTTPPSFAWWEGCTLDLAPTAPTGGAEGAVGRDARKPYQRALLILKWCTVVYVCRIGRRLDSRDTISSEDNQGTAVVETIEAVVAEDAVLGSRAGKAGVLDCGLSPISRTLDELFTGCAGFLRTTMDEGECGQRDSG
jgi:hypothetical protein